MRPIAILAFAGTALVASLLVAPVAADAAQSPRARKPATAANDANVTVIYRCTDADGMLSLQNTPCPRGQRQERSVIAKPVDPPASAQAPAPAVVAGVTVTAPAPAPPPAAPATRGEDESPLPPPPLYLCHTPSGGSYVHETGNPPERCREVPLVNVSSSATLPEHDAGVQCVMEQDRCARIPDQELCATWQRRLREATAMLELGNPDLVEQATRQRDQAQRVIDRSCLTEH